MPARPQACTYSCAHLRTQFEGKTLGADAQCTLLDVEPTAQLRQLVGGVKGASARYNVMHCSSSTTTSCGTRDYNYITFWMTLLCYLCD